MISVKRSFTLLKSELGKKFRVENNNLDLSELIAESGFEAVRLGNYARAHRDERNKKMTADLTFRYVQISDIDVVVGRIKSYQTFTGATAPNNARRVMAEGDVLVSTRRPTRGAVVAVGEEFAGDMASVFFTSLRVRDRSVLLPEYLALFLRTSLGRFQFQSMVTETAYPVITDDDVENLILLLPSVQAQRDLVATHSASVDEYFAAMNSAQHALVRARQRVEDELLGAHAETLPLTQMGLLQEVGEVEDADSSETDV